jgi:hypothetical protein
MSFLLGLFLGMMIGSTVAVVVIAMVKTNLD